MTDADFRTEIEMFGNKFSRGSFIVNLVLSGCGYRTQLFVYLKACGREDPRRSTSGEWIRRRRTERTVPSLQARREYEPLTVNLLGRPSLAEWIP
jgi:hypothetical protein